MTKTKETFKAPKIKVRQDAVDIVHDYPESHGSSAGILARLYDIEDIVAKLSKKELPARPPRRADWEAAQKAQWEKDQAKADKAAEAEQE